MGRRLLAGAAVSAAVLLATTPGGAAHWPAFGGDAGRSGYQPVDEGGLPVQFLYARTGLADRDVRTSIVTTTGDPSSQRLVYGTDDGVVHLRVLSTGAAVGPPGGTDVSAAADPFGGGAGSASFVDTSTPAGLGQVFAVHNELYQGGQVGLQIAQVDEASGAVLADVDVADTLGYRIQSSALVTPPDGAGNRALFFVAGEQAGTREQLFKVPLGNAASPSASIGAAERTADLNANPLASPTLVYFRDAGGAPRAYVAVGTFSGLRTFAVDDLSPGPSDETIGEPVRTPTTPVTSTGIPPGAPGSGLATAPAVYAASGGAATTTVHRFTQVGSSQALSRASSVPLAGNAAPGLMTNQEVAPAGIPDGHIFVTTSANLYSVRTNDLAVAARFDAGDSLAGGSTGFSFTTAAGTGELVFVVTDGGRQLALEAQSLRPVDRELFSPPRAAEGSQSSFGQPSISGRFLQVPTDRGVFVYTLRRATPPTGYWLAASDGGMFSYGDAGFFGSTGDIRLNKPVTAMAPTASREGYWLAASDGGIFSFGDAGFFGSTGAMALNSPVGGMVPTRTGQGYWLVAADGGVFTFGDAQFLGSTGDLRLNKPIVGMAATPSGDGYWLVAADGGIFTFGDAEFLGSTGDIALNKPVVGMAAAPNGNGYWLVASDGGIFSFGRAGFLGSTGDIVLNSPIVAMAASATGAGYAFTAADGGVFAFGDVPFLGAAAELGRLNQPVVTLAIKP
ncbi:MAG: hypothetical protein KY439_02645 [Actinobacteria bacterium]|nr:hypothetical protein [Actinomycetota bacterium]